MKLVTDISRYIVGLLFIFSGLVKAVDPVGFSYKLTEYFEVFHNPPAQMEFWSWIHIFPWEFFIDIALPISIFLVIFEIVLGVATLTGYKMKFTAWSLVLLILFFAALTFASAYYDIVKTCGCFGDAIALTPWQSFYKDCVLLFFVLIIFVNRNWIEEGEVNKTHYVMAVILLSFLGWLSFGRLEWGFTFFFPLGVLVVFYGLNFIGKSNRAMIVNVLSTVVITAFTLYCFFYLPAKDFRAYAVGKNIPEQMIGVPDSLAYTYILKNKATGKEEKFPQFPENYTEKYDYVNFETIVVKEGIPAKIQDFSISDAYGNDVTLDFLEGEGYQFLLIEYNLDESNKKVQAKANEFATKAQADGHVFVALTASPNSIAQKFKQDNGSTFDYYFSDGTVLKTIIRANPGLMVIKGGVVLGKWHYNAFPSYEDVKADLLK